MATDAENTCIFVVATVLLKDPIVFAFSEIGFIAVASDVVQDDTCLLTGSAKLGAANSFTIIETKLSTHNPALHRLVR